MRAREFLLDLYDVSLRRARVEVSAEEFLEAPEEFSQEGYWVESKVVS